jgi:putative transposase
LTQGESERLWQRNYYEHVIRDGDGLDRIRRYIVDNPVQWAFDRGNPQTICPEEQEAWAQT